MGKYYLGTGNQQINFQVVDATGVINDLNLSGLYLSITGKAADADKLDNYDSSFFRNAANLTGSYTGSISGKAADSELLDGYDSSYFLNGANITGTVALSGTFTGYYTGAFSGTITHTDSITFHTGLGINPDPNELTWLDDLGTMQLGLKGGNVDLRVGLQNYEYVTNRTASTLNKGTVVYVSGALGNRPAVSPAIGTADSASAATFGILAENIASMADGYAITNGILTNLNTTGFAEGAALYLSPTVSGAVTSTKPQAPDHSVLVGFCVRSHASAGEILVKIQNGLELDELHDVRILNKQNNDIIRYNAPSGIWYNSDTLAINGTGANYISGDLGIGTSGPSAKLHILGADKRQIIASTTDNAALVLGQWDGATNRIESSTRKLLITSYASGISLGINGSENVHVSTSGNLGVGTLTPAWKIDSVGASSADSYVRSLGGSGSTKGGFIIGNNDAGAKNYGSLYWDNANNTAILRHEYSAGYLGLGAYSRTADLVILASNGNVGIGTTTPYADLEVKAKSRSWGEGIIVDPVSDATNNYSAIFFRKYGAEGSTYTGTWALGKNASGASGGQVLQVVMEGLTGGALYRADASQQWKTNGDSIFGFNVGIGTTSPAFTHGSGLQVNAATTATIRVQYNSGYATELFADSTGTNLWQLSAASLTLGTNNTERIRIDSSGNVGIGTTSPTQKLDVNGNTIITGSLTVSGSDATIHDVSIGRGAGSISTNTRVGNSALSSNTTGNNNTAVGYQALNNNTTGLYNIAVGANALPNNSGGRSNVAIGFQALNTNTGDSIGNGSANIAVGGNALLSNSSGYRNIAVGVQALQTVTTGGFNTAIGFNSGSGITTGFSNTIIGSNVIGLPADLSGNIIIADGDGNRRINVDNSGNVGIGTTAPTEKLQVAGSANIDGSINFLRGSGEYSTYIKANDYVDGGYNGSTLRYWIELGSKGGTHIVLNTDGSTASAENSYDHFTIWQAANGSGAIAAGARKFWITNIGRVNFADGMWHKSSDAIERIYFGSSASTYYKGGGSGANHTFRNSSDADILTLNNSKDATLFGNLTAKGTVHTFGADSSQRVEITSNNGSSQGLIEFYNRGTSAYFAARYLALSHSFEQGNATFSGNITISKASPELAIRSASDAAAQIQYLTFGSPNYNRAQFRVTSGGTSDGSTEFYTFNAGSPTLSQSWSKEGNVTFAQTVTIGGNLIINGTTTTVNSTVTTIDDPIITLGGDTAPASDDNKDRGVEFRWHNGSAAKVGFFGFDDSTGYFTFIPDATNSSEVFSGTQGDIQATNFRGTLIGSVSNALTAGSYLTGSPSSSYNGSAAVTFAVDATSANTASKVVARDGSGNFAAGAITSTSISTSSGTSNGVRVHSNSGITASGNYMNFFTSQTSGWAFNANGTGADANTVVSISSGGNLTVNGTGDSIIAGTLGIGAAAYYSNKLTVDGSALALGLGIAKTRGDHVTTITNPDGGNVSSNIAFKVANSSGTMLLQSTYGGAINTTGSVTVGGALTVSGAANSTIAGNLGIACTPSAWSLIKGVQLNGNAFIGGFNTSAYFSQNWVYDGAEKFISNGYAARYLQDVGTHSFQVTASGTAGGALTWITAAYVATSGDFLIGTTSDQGYKLDVNGTGRIQGNSTVGGTLTVNGAEAAIYGADGYQLKFGYSSAYFWKMGRQANGSLIFNDSSADRVTFTNTGNVGIGTTAPAAPLEVIGSTATVIVRNSTASSYGGIRIYNDQNSAGRALEIDYSGSTYANPLLTNGPTGESASIATVGAYPLVLGTSNTARLTILSGGNVGIGTITPGTKLSVNGTANFGNISSGMYVSDSTIHIGGTSVAQLSFEHVGSATAAIALASSGFNFGHQNSSPSYNFKYSSTYNGNYATSGTTFVSFNPTTSYINSTNVGVGTTSPSALFQVSTTAGGNFRLDSNGSGGHYYAAETYPRLGLGRDYDGPAGYISFNRDGTQNTNKVAISSPAASEMGFYIGTTEKIRINSSGNVGIGQTNPTQAKLQISSGGISTQDSTRTFASTTFNTAIGSSNTRTVAFNGTGGSSVWWCGDGTPSFAIDSSGGDTSFWRYSSGWVARMVLDANGFGINTTSPLVKLTTRSGTNSLPATSGTAQSGAGLRVEGGDNAVIDIGTNSVDTWIQATDKSALDYYYRLLLNPRGGNVGIGVTTNPAYKLEVNGSFAATTKSFVIKHPTKEGKKLRYGSLEGPENGVYVRGKATSKVIELPDYWTKLVDPESISVQLTPIGSHQKLYIEKIEDNKVYIANENLLAKNINCFFYILAERADVEKLQTEIDA